MLRRLVLFFVILIYCMQVAGACRALRPKATAGKPYEKFYYLSEDNSEAKKVSSAGNATIVSSKEELRLSSGTHAAFNKIQSEELKIARIAENLHEIYQYYYYYFNYDTPSATEKARMERVWKRLNRSFRPYTKNSTLWIHFTSRLFYYLSRYHDFTKERDRIIIFRSAFQEGYIRRLKKLDPDASTHFADLPNFYKRAKDVTSKNFIYYLTCLVAVMPRPSRHKCESAEGMAYSSSVRMEAYAPGVEEMEAYAPGVEEPEIEEEATHDLFLVPLEAEEEKSSRRLLSRKRFTALYSAIYESGFTLLSSRRRSGKDIVILQGYEDVFPQNFYGNPSKFIEESENIERPDAFTDLPAAIKNIFSRPYDLSRIKRLELKDRQGMRVVVISKRIEPLRTRYPEEEIDLAKEAYDVLESRAHSNDDDKTEFGVQEFIGIVFSNGNFYLLSLEIPGKSIYQRNLEEQTAGYITMHINRSDLNLSPTQKLQNLLNGTIVDVASRNIIAEDRAQAKSTRYVLIDFETHPSLEEISEIIRRKIRNNIVKSSSTGTYIMVNESKSTKAMMSAA